MGGDSQQQRPRRRRHPFFTGAPGRWAAELAKRLDAEILAVHVVQDSWLIELNAIQLKTDRRNQRAQRAIERLGAVKEGTFRKHRLMWDGVVRDTVYYSILDSEWQGVKQRLEGFLERGRSPVQSA